MTGVLEPDVYKDPRRPRHEAGEPRIASSGSALGWPEMALIGTLVLLTNVPHLFVHYVDWDEAAAMAESWAMTQGQVLYRDIVQIHPVLHFWVLVPFFSLLKPEWAPLAIRIMNTLLVLLGAVLVGRLVFTWLVNRRLAFLGGLLFIFYCSRMAAPSPSTYGEFYAIFPILLSLQVLHFSKCPEPQAHYLTGFLWGVAFFFKQTAIFDALGLFAGYIYLTRMPRARKTTATGWMALGFISVVAAISAYFLCHGAFLETWRSMFVRPLFYANSGAGRRWPDLLILAEALVGRFTPSLLAVVLGVRRLVLDQRDHVGLERTRDAAFFLALLIWSGSDLVGLGAVGRYYPHYLFQLVPQASVLPSFILSRMRVRHQSATLVAAVIAIFAMAIAEFVPEMLLLSREHWVPRPVQQSTAVADYIRKHTRRDDRIFLYDTDHLDIFFLSRRLSNNGVYQFVNMMTENMHDPAEQQRLRKAFLSRLPSVIVVSQSADLAGIVRRPQQHDHRALSTVEFFGKVLRERYNLATTLDGQQIYRLVP